MSKRLNLLKRYNLLFNSRTRKEDFSLKYVYLLLSRERNITVEKIKCDIENAVRNATFSYSTLYNFFKYYDGRKKITTKYLIFLIVNSKFSNQFQVTIQRLTIGPKTLSIFEADNVYIKFRSY